MAVPRFILSPSLIQVNQPQYDWERRGHPPLLTQKHPFIPLCFISTALETTWKKPNQTRKGGSGVSHTRLWKAGLTQNNSISAWFQEAGCAVLRSPLNRSSWEEHFNLMHGMGSDGPVSESIMHRQRWQLGCRSSWCIRWGVGGWSRWLLRALPALRFSQVCEQNAASSVLFSKQA